MANPLIASSAFVRKYALSSASSVNSAAKGLLDKGLLDKGLLDKGLLDKGLLDKGLLTCNRGEYQVYDLFLDIWIRNHYQKWVLAPKL